jgi:hypothetical protein
MSGAGAEQDVVFAQPGCQHRPHSRTNGLARQHEHNATKRGERDRKQESVYLLSEPHYEIRPLCEQLV